MKIYPLPKFQVCTALLVITSFLFGAPAFAQQNESGPPNFLLLIGDDMGIETLKCFDVGDDVAHTPNLDELCDQSMRFENFWAQPVCSPTRASLLTGQFGFRNGVGTPAGTPTGVDWKVPPDNSGVATIGAAGFGGGMGAAMGAMGAGMGMGADGGRPSISPDTYSMLNALKADKTKGYETAAVGKWHLANNANGGLDHPQRVGFDYYAGDFGSAPASYYGWSKTVTGSAPKGSSTYTTTDTVNEGIAWLKQRDDKPWFLWVAFNAPHTPVQLPPKELLKSKKSLSLSPAGGPDADEHAYFNAMIEAMDTEIGRLLASIDARTLANTYVIFLGDNGTTGSVIKPPFARGHAKGSVYQGGVSVPFMISGPGIEAGQVTKAMGNVADMYATVLELADAQAGAKIPTGLKQDTVSLAPVMYGKSDQVREFNYADHFGPTRGGSSNERAIRNEHYKIVHDIINEKEEFFNLEADPYENNDLLAAGLSPEAQANYDGLKSRLDVLIKSK
jgi:arylsulfatase B